jgi:hypothetical protein
MYRNFGKLGSTIVLRESKRTYTTCNQNYRRENKYIFHFQKLLTFYIFQFQKSFKNSSDWKIQPIKNTSKRVRKEKSKFKVFVAPSSYFSNYV